MHLSQRDQLRSRPNLGYLPDLSYQATASKTVRRDRRRSCCCSLLVSGAQKHPCAQKNRSERADRVQPTFLAAGSES